MLAGAPDGPHSGAHRTQASEDEHQRVLLDTGHAGHVAAQLHDHAGAPANPQQEHAEGQCNGSDICPRRRLKGGQLFAARKLHGPILPSASDMDPGSAFVVSGFMCR